MRSVAIIRNPISLNVLRSGLAVEAHNRCILWQSLLTVYLIAYHLARRYVLPSLRCPSVCKESLITDTTTSRGALHIRLWVRDPPIPYSGLVGLGDVHKPTGGMLRPVEIREHGSLAIGRLDQRGKVAGYYGVQVKVQ